MEAMRQLLLASGIAVCGGLAGALASWFLASRRTRREAARLASLVDAEPTALHETGLSELAPLLEAWRQRQDALQAGGEAHAAQYRQPVRRNGRADAASRRCATRQGTVPGGQQP
jgi:hypothetical protein